MRYAFSFFCNAPKCISHRQFEIIYCAEQTNKEFFSKNLSAHEALPLALRMQKAESPESRANDHNNCFITLTNDKILIWSFNGCVEGKMAEFERV
jgi:hypothetical protein